MRPRTLFIYFTFYGIIIKSGITTSYSPSPTLPYTLLTQNNLTSANENLDMDNHSGCPTDDNLTHRNDIRRNDTERHTDNANPSRQLHKSKLDKRSTTFTQRTKLNEQIRRLATSDQRISKENDYDQQKEIISLLTAFLRKPTSDHVQLPAFNGEESDDIGIYFEDLDAIAEFHGWNEKAKVDAIPLTLHKHAKMFYLTLPDNVRRNYQNVRNAFKNHFDPPEIKWQKRNQLYSSKQESKTLEEFINELDTLAFKVGVADETKRDIFINGLKNNLKQYVLLKQPFTYADAISAARLKNSISGDSEEITVLKEIKEIIEIMAKQQITSPVESAINNISFIDFARQNESRSTNLIFPQQDLESQYDKREVDHLKYELNRSKNRNGSDRMHEKITNATNDHDSFLCSESREDPRIPCRMSRQYDPGICNHGKDNRFQNNGQNLNLRQNDDAPNIHNMHNTRSGFEPRQNNDFYSGAPRLSHSGPTYNSNAYLDEGNTACFYQFDNYYPYVENRPNENGPSNSYNFGTNEIEGDWDENWPTPTYGYNGITFEESSRTCYAQNYESVQYSKPMLESEQRLNIKTCSNSYYHTEYVCEECEESVYVGCYDNHEYILSDMSSPTNNPSRRNDKSDAHVKMHYLNAHDNHLENKPDATVEITTSSPDHPSLHDIQLPMYCQYHDEKFDENNDTNYNEIDVFNKTSINKTNNNKQYDYDISRNNMPLYARNYPKTYRPVRYDINSRSNVCDKPEPVINTSNMDQNKVNITMNGHKQMCT